MKSIIPKLVKCCTLVSLIVPAGTAPMIAQSIQGQTPVNINEAKNYTYNPGYLVPGANWTAVKGTVPPLTGRVGTTYNVNITWNSGGDGSVSFRDGEGNVIATKAEQDAGRVR